MIACAERPTSRTGFGGNASALTARATPPPISASITRVGGKPDPEGSRSTSRIADTAASVTSTGPPPRTTAVAIASTTSTPSCHPPLPIPLTSRSATPTPSTTPPISSIARSGRWP